MIVTRADGQIEEQDPPTVLRSHQIVVLDVWGSLFFAGARTLQDSLPDPGEDGSIVILRMRRHSSADATLVQVLDDYARRLSLRNGRLYLSGVSDRLAEQLGRSGKMLSRQNVEIVESNLIIGASTKAAFEQARRWVEDEKAFQPGRPAKSSCPPSSTSS